MNSDSSGADETRDVEPNERTPENTRQQLLLAAERLFARDGTAGVSLRAIAREAGQRNTGAVHYHFGSREAVIEAIFEFRATAIDEARTAALEAIPKTVHGEERIRAVVAAIVRPFAQEASEAGGENHYARFVAQLIQSNDETAHRIWRGRFSRGIELAFTMLAESLPRLPKPVLQQRFATTFRLAVYSVADLDQEVRSSRSAAALAEQRQLQIENIIDMLAAAFAAPVSEDVAKAAQSGLLLPPRSPGSLSEILRKTGGRPRVTPSA